MEYSIHPGKMLETRSESINRLGYGRDSRKRDKEERKKILSSKLKTIGEFVNNGIAVTALAGIIVGGVFLLGRYSKKP